MLIGPTAFGRQVAPGIHTTVILPFCDGDVTESRGARLSNCRRSGVRRSGGSAPGRFRGICACALSPAGARRRAALPRIPVSEPRGYHFHATWRQAGNLNARTLRTPAVLSGDRVTQHDGKFCQNYVMSLLNFAIEATRAGMRLQVLFHQGESLVRARGTAAWPSSWRTRTGPTCSGSMRTSVSRHRRPSGCCFRITTSPLACIR